MSTSASFDEILRAELSGIIDLSDRQLRRLNEHFELLVRWNERLNLTTILDLPEAAIRHYCESLFVAAHIDGVSVVDVGSGPGFPGIPIAVARPEWDITLIESHKRKAAFLREASRDLKNVRVLDKRAEDTSGHHDWLVSRAVDPRSILRLRLATRFAILIGEDDAAVAGGGHVLSLPWGERRRLAIGEAAN
jgi:16S rRNA (guanine527-N7)-methyltransferase